MVVSNVLFRMKPLFLKNIYVNNRTMGNLNGYGLMNSNFSRYFKLYAFKCQRGCRRLFCDERKNAVLFYSNRNDNIFSNNIPRIHDLYTKQSIVSKDFNKRIIVYDSCSNIIDKLFAFKIDECGKHINLTKTFLADPKFLKFAYYLVKNTKEDDIVLYNINDT